LDAAFLALAFSGAVLLAGSLRHRASHLVPAGLLALLSVIAVSYVVARYFSYDPCYAPTLRRMSDGGIVPRGWIVFLVGLSLVAAWSVFRDRRLGMFITSAVCWLSCVAWVAGSVVSGSLVRVRLAAG
jgi:hypothetical protein